MPPKGQHTDGQPPGARGRADLPLAKWIDVPLVYLLLVVLTVAFWQTETGHAFVRDLQAQGERGEKIGGCAITFLLANGSWHSYGAIQGLLDGFRRPLWWQYKMHSRDTLTYWDMLPNVLRNQVLVGLPVIYGMWSATASHRGFRIDGAPPSPLSFLAHLVGAVVGYEVFFYFVHRMMHCRALWRFHRLHHKTWASVAISGQYADPLDFLCMTVFPVAVGPMLLDSHVTVMWLFVVVGSLNSIHSHGAYRFPFFPVPDSHEQHHAKFRVNYGVGLLDRAFGTTHDSPDWKQRWPR